MIREIIEEAKDAKDAFDSMFKDSMDNLKAIDKMIDKAIKEKDKKKLDHISKVLADTQKKIGK